MADANKIATLEKELADLKLLLGAQRPPQVVTKLIPPVTKVRRFSGESDDLEDWITDTERTVGQLGLKDKEAANHVLLHL